MTNSRINCRYTLSILLFLVVGCSILPSQTPSPAQATDMIRAFYKNNGGCELPCLWGIVPGQTQIETVERDFAQIATFDDITRSVDHFQTVVFTVLAPNDLVGIYDDENWSFHLRLENDVVVGLLSGITVVEEFSNPSLAEFLSHFGQPEEIWIRVIESMPKNENPDYVIAFYYPSKGIFLSWRGEAGSIVDNTNESITVMACPQYIPTKADTSKGSYPPFFYLFSSNKSLPFEEIVTTHLSEDPGGPYQPLSTAEVQRFYVMYLDTTNQNCFPLSYTW